MGVILLLTVIISVLVLCQPQYTNRFDNINLDEIIQNDRLLRNYSNCLLETGKCTKNANELKRLVPDALATDCSKCSEKQRTGIRRMIKYLSTNKKDLWNELIQKYDPDGVYRTKYADVIVKEGIQV